MPDARQRQREQVVSAATPLRRVAERFDPAGERSLVVLRGASRLGLLSATTVQRALALGLEGTRAGDVVDPRPAAPSRRPASIRRRLEAGLGPETVGMLSRFGREAERGDAQVFLVGGAVRDLLLDRPVRDLDLVVVGDTRRLGAKVARACGLRFSWNARFRTGRLDSPGGRAIELARARSERYPHPAALPRVRPADLETDLGRRDFSVNAIACSLMPGELGRIVDPRHGRTDLRSGRIRLLHGVSILDDPTRAFRAIRLASATGFRIEPASRALIRAARRLGAFEQLSASRLRRELALLFDAPARSAAVRSFTSYGLWSVLGLSDRPAPARLEELRRLDRLLARPDAEPDLRVWVTVLALMLRGSRRAVRQRLVGRLGVGRRIARLLVESPTRAAALARRAARAPIRPSAIRRICRGEPAETLLLATAWSARPGPRDALWRQLVRDREMQPDIGGDELVRAGVRPGPLVARGLEAALGAKLDGRADGAAAQLAVALRAVRGA